MLDFTGFTTIPSIIFLPIGGNPEKIRKNLKVEKIEFQVEQPRKLIFYNKIE